MLGGCGGVVVGGCGGCVWLRLEIEEGGGLDGGIWDRGGDAGTLLLWVSGEEGWKMIDWVVVLP